MLGIEVISRFWIFFSRNNYCFIWSLFWVLTASPTFIGLTIFSFSSAVLCVAERKKKAVDSVFILAIPTILSLQQWAAEYKKEIQWPKSWKLPTNSTLSETLTSRKIHSINTPNCKNSPMLRSRCSIQSLRVVPHQLSSPDLFLNLRFGYDMD